VLRAVDDADYRADVSVLANAPNDATTPIHVTIPCPSRTLSDSILLQRGEKAHAMFVGTCREKVFYRSKMRQTEL
jgi:hypothetical protein